MNVTLAPAPRRADDLRNVQATRLAANLCAHLPVGFWQRRLAARAFGLSVVPPVDRHRPARAVCWTLGGTDPVFVLDTSVALWGFTPRGQRDPVDTLQMLRAIGQRPFTAVLSVVPFPKVDVVHAAPATGERRPAPRRLQILPSDALQMGVLHWHDLMAVFDEAAQELEHPPLVALAAQAADTLRALERAALTDGAAVQAW